MRMLRETLAISVMNLRNLPLRLKPTLVAVIGFLGVVLVFVALLSIREGFAAVLRGTGSDSVATIFKSGPGALGTDDLASIARTPGVARNHGKPIMDGNTSVDVSLPAGHGRQRSFTMRGVGPDVAGIWPQLHVIKGRMYRSGLNEALVGRQAARRFPRLRIGRHFTWDHHRWTVVGIFASGHDVHESEIWTNLSSVQDAIHAGNTESIVYVRLTSPAVFDSFKKALGKVPNLNVSVYRESERYQDSAKGLTTMISLVGGIVAILMGLGAMFGALNTMYNAVASRRREIATLRALGFGRMPIVVSVLTEALILGLAGGILGAIIGYLAFNGYQASTGALGSTVAFNFAVTPQLMATGIGYALVLGFIGGLFPAIRAARAPIAQALKGL